MTQENHSNNTRLLQHETRHYNGSRVFTVSECNVGVCTPVYEVSPEKKAERVTKLITNRELYWWDPLVGNGIIQPFNWMGLTFAVQGVEAFVSVLRHNLHPYRCIMLHWLRRRRFLPPKGRLTVTLGRVKHIYAHTFQLMGTLWRHQGAAWIKTNKRAIGLHIFIHHSLKTFLTIKFTHMSQGPLITLNRYLSALDLSAVSFYNYNPR